MKNSADHLKPHIFRHYGNMFRRAFQFNGTSTKQEYWYAMLVQGILLTVALTMALATFVLEALWLQELELFTAVISAAAALLFLAGGICSISLTVRRLRDCGKNVFWTLLLLLVGLGTAAVMVMCSAYTVSFAAESNHMGNVYGPPPWVQEFDPYSNQNEDVYGPPVWDEDDFDPKANIPEPVYGPPSWFEQEPLPLPEDDDEYDPAININPEVYGPPSWFEQGKEK